MCINTKQEGVQTVESDSSQKQPLLGQEVINTKSKAQEIPSEQNIL